MDDDQLLVGGAAFGTLCSELHERVDNLMKKSKKEDPFLGEIKDTLDSLETLSHKKQRHKNDRETEKFHKDRIANGIKLLDACLEDPTLLNKYEYKKKIYDLDDSLKMVAIQLLISAADEREIQNEDAERLVPGWVTKQQPDPAVDQPATPPISDMDDTMKIMNISMNVITILFLILVVITMVVWVINIMFRVSSVIKVVDEFIEYCSWFGDTSAAETTYYDGKLLLVTSRWALLFLARLGVLLVMIFIDAVVKFTVYGILFYLGMMKVVGSVVSFRNLYRRGFSWSRFRKPILLTAWTLYFLYICVLLCTSVKCHCKSSI